MNYIILFLIILALLGFLGKLFKVSLKLIGKLMLNALGGFILLYILNYFGSYIGLSVEINIFSTIFVGFFGIFGIIILIFLGRWFCER